MKNKLQDVRDHLVLAMERLNEEGADPTAVKAAVDRAKAVSTVANSFIDSVKVEIDAIRVASDCGMLPVSVATPVLAERKRDALGMGK